MCIRDRLNGATLSLIFMAYTLTSIASVFFITAGTFGVMAAYGYFTKRDPVSYTHLDVYKRQVLRCFSSLR